MKLIALVLTTLTLFAGVTYAQDVGQVDYPYLGVQFTIPQGWQGKEIEIGYILGSNTEPGLILLKTHEARTIDVLKQEAKNDIHEEGGTRLQLSGELEAVGNNGVGGVSTGTVEYQAARAYIAAVINPFGQGVMVLAATNEENYSKRYAQLAKEVAASLKFAHPQEPPAVTEWKESLKGAKLTYLSTSGGFDYSGYSGSSSRSEILLCPNQQFTYYDSSASSFDTSGGFGSTNSSDQGQGNWEVSSTEDGKALLLLHFNDARKFKYRIDYKDNKTYLGDSRYFRTYDHGECYQ